jgi:hypothetical protein
VRGGGGGGRGLSRGDLRIGGARARGGRREWGDSEFRIGVSEEGARLAENVAAEAGSPQFRSARRLTADATRALASGFGEFVWDAG